MPQWPSEQFIVFAHRGASRVAPENTLAALQEAQKCGAKAIESDVQITKDQKLFIFHDSRLDRTTNGYGVLAKKTSQQLYELDAGAWFSDKFLGQRIPTLIDWLQCAAQLNLWLNLEIKLECRDQIEVLSQLLVYQIQRYWPAHCPIPLLSSFSLGALECVAQKTQAYPLAFISENSLSRSDIKNLLSIGIISVHHPVCILDPDYIQWMHQQGFRVLAYTINDRAVAEQLRLQKVDGIFTDNQELYDMADILF